MRSDARVYNKMYERLKKVVVGKDVLEIATGPGLLAKNIASSSKSMIATDYSDGMIKQAKKGEYPESLVFEVADATDLPFGNDMFDVVIIANALHIMPNPEMALSEIHRVLRDDGMLVCPNFVNHKKGLRSGIWSKILSIAGVKFEHQWDMEEYLEFIKFNGWKVTYSEYMPARIPIAYVECMY